MKHIYILPILLFTMLSNIVSAQTYALEVIVLEYEVNTAICEDDLGADEENVKIRVNTRNSTAIGGGISTKYFCGTGDGVQPIQQDCNCNPGSERPLLARVQNYTDNNFRLRFAAVEIDAMSGGNIDWGVDCAGSTFSQDTVCNQNDNWQSLSNSNKWTERTITFTDSVAGDCGTFDFWTDYYENVRLHVEVTFKTIEGNPAVFGDNRWYIYAYDGVGLNDNGDHRINPLRYTSYAGYDSLNTLGVDISDLYGTSSSPASSSSYQGSTCISNDTYTSIAKRRGFECGEYNITINNTNTSRFFNINDENIGRTNNITNDNNITWTGILDETSTIELRYADSLGIADFEAIITKTDVPLEPGTITHPEDGNTFCNTHNPLSMGFTTAPSGGVRFSTADNTRPDYEYYWVHTLDGGARDTVATTLAYDPPLLANGDHEYYLIVVDSCTKDSTNTIAFTVIETPTSSEVTDDQFLCEGEAAQDVFTNLPGSSFTQWEISNNPTFPPTGGSDITSVIGKNPSSPTTLDGNSIDVALHPSTAPVRYIRTHSDGTEGNHCPIVSSDYATIRINHPENIVMNDATGSCTVNSSDWTYLFEPNAGRLIAAINSQGQNLGNVTASIYYHTGDPFTVPTITGGCGTQAVLNRNFVFNSDNTFVSDVLVRMYFTDSELDDLRILAGCGDPNGCQDDDDVCDINDLVVTQVSGAASEDGVYDPTDGSLIFHTSSNGNRGNLTFGSNYVEISVSQFSEFWIHGSEHSVTLPVELISFSAKNEQDNHIAVEWTTVTEVNNNGFELQRSINGKDFEKIAWIEGNGSTSDISTYYYNDDDVQDALYYYRLKQIDFDGEYEYSHIVSAMIENSKDFTIGEIFPNPSNNIIYIPINSRDEYNTIEYSIIDIYGKPIKTAKMTLDMGRQEFAIDLSEYPKGIYRINIKNGNNSTVKTFALW
ncbi:MAG: T9SS type A sorting domain-containing protein [Chitinophagales bacterium]